MATTSYESALPWILWAVCMAPLLMYAIVALRRSVNIDAFGAAIERLVDAHNLDRALKLCTALPEAPALAATQRALERAMRGPTNDGAAGYRAFSPEALERDLAGLRDAWNTGWNLALSPVRAWLPWTVAGALFAAADGFLWLRSVAAVSMVAPAAALVWSVRVMLVYARDRDALWTRFAPRFEALLRARPPA